MSPPGSAPPRPARRKTAGRPRTCKRRAPPPPSSPRDPGCNGEGTERGGGRGEGGGEAGTGSVEGRGETWRDRQAGRRTRAWEGERSIGRSYVEEVRREEG